MPLKAHLDGQPIVAPLLDDAAWNSLRYRTGVLRMPCCGEAAYTRESKLGVRHFVHKRKGGCDTKPETAEHLFIKSELAKGCHDAGYQVETEAVGEQWRADILAIRDSARLALEIQWSRQNREVTVFRQERYATSGIRCAWIFRKLRRDLNLQRDVPAFQLQQNEDKTYTVEGLPLRAFACALLSGHFRLCSHVRLQPVQNVDIVFAKDTCWRCKRELHVFTDLQDGNRGLRTVHDWKVGDISWVYDSPIRYHPQVFKAIREFQKSPEGKQLKLGSVKPRYSQTNCRSYPSQGCPHCDGLFGDNYLRDPDLWDESRVAILSVPITLPQPHFEQNAHWCYSESRVFCDDQ